MHTPTCASHHHPLKHTRCFVLTSPTQLLLKTLRTQLLAQRCHGCHSCTHMMQWCNNMMTTCTQHPYTYKQQEQHLHTMHTHFVHTHFVPTVTGPTEPKRCPYTSVVLWDGAWIVTRTTTTTPTPLTAKFAQQLADDRLGARRPSGKYRR